MKKIWLYIVVFLSLSLTLFAFYFFNEKSMYRNKESKRAITLYEMDYGKWDSSFREKINEGKDSYKKWFFENARKVEIPDNIYKEVIIENPIINTGITNTILEKSAHHQFTDTSSDLIYFVLDPQPYLMIMEQPLYKQYRTSMLTSFGAFLQDIAENKVFVIAEYDKKYGWFDYDKISSQKEKFKEQHELEMKQVKERKKKT